MDATTTKPSDRWRADAEELLAQADTLERKPKDGMNRRELASLSRAIDDRRAAARILVKLSGEALLEGR